MEIPSMETEWEGNRLQSTGAYLLPIHIGGRLYLFMPSIMPKTLAKDLVVPEQTTFETLATSYPVNTTVPSCTWDIQLGWTELVSGSWSPKRVSSGSLSVASTAPLSQFRIDPTLVGKKLNIKVSYSPTADKQCTEIGSFVFCADQTGDTVPNIIQTTEKFSTYFQKPLGKDFDPETLLVDGKYPNDGPLIWVPPGLEEKATEDLTWTLSKMPQRVTGLVVSVKEGDGTSVSYFNVPKTE